jgi:predicted acyl esterase
MRFQWTRIGFGVPLLVLGAYVALVGPVRAQTPSVSCHLEWAANMCCAPALLPAGAHDQSEVELRGDVLVYTSAPLEQAVAVIGPVSVKLWAKSSARDTDFTAKLVDVHLDGYAHNVLDRIVRARYRWGSKLPPSLIEPRKGYARNLNTGRSNEQDDRIETARQTVLHDEEHASHLLLSVVPGVTGP